MGFFKVLNDSVFEKTMANMRKHRNIKLATTERRRNYLVWEPNYQADFKVFHIISISNRKEKHIDTYK